MFLDTHSVYDLQFTIKDVLWLCGLLITFLSAWFKLKIDSAKQNEKIKKKLH